jgi:outer membrane protein assembly factor BamB
MLVHRAVCIGSASLLLLLVNAGCSRNWLAERGFIPVSHGWRSYRNDNWRTGNQPFASKLSDPKAVKTLAVRWVFPATGKVPGFFDASPIVVNGTVFVGSNGGYMYAIDEESGALKWQYPPSSAPGLVSPASDPRECKLTCYGIGSSASYWDRDDDGAIVFGAQDPALDKFGSARLYALNARTGTLIWKSDPVAILNGTALNSHTELHERIKYSSPLIFNDRAYVGVSDAYYDHPIQNGRVVAVDLQTGHIDPVFNYVSTGSHRGGDVWNSPAAGSEGVFFTTGNTRHVGPADQPEPSPNYGLSMVRVDKKTGAVVWAFQPVPYDLDKDPDWAAGATVMSASCGELVASVQKDGWAYAVDAGGGIPASPNVRWQFPPTGYPFAGYEHGGDDYKHPGAAWNDVFIVTTGGESRPADVTAGYGVLQALNACEKSEANRVRWIAQIPDAKPDKPGSGGPGYAVGSPTVTGGVVYVGTNTGHLIVLADPSIWPASGSQCSNVKYANEADCERNNYVLVSTPAVLANVSLPDGGDIAGLRREPALADGKVFVANNLGHIYMLSP